MLLEARKPKIKVSIGPVFGDSLLPGLQMPAFLLCPRVAGNRVTERKEPSSLPSLLISTNLTMKAPPPYYLPKTLPPNTIPLGVLMYELRGAQTHSP